MALIGLFVLCDLVGAWANFVDDILCLVFVLWLLKYFFLLILFNNLHPIFCNESDPTSQFKLLLKFGKRKSLFAILKCPKLNKLKRVFIQLVLSHNCFKDVFILMLISV